MNFENQPKKRLGRYIKPSEVLLRRALSLLHQWSVHPRFWPKTRTAAILAGEAPLDGLYQYFFRLNGLPRTLTSEETMRGQGLRDLHAHVLQVFAEAERNIRLVREGAREAFGGK